MHITDFGIARVWSPDNAKDTSGTPGYMAPEVMCKQNHGIAADFFAVGVIAYECMIGKVYFIAIFMNRGLIKVKHVKIFESKFWQSKLLLS